jgi:hypothetical protein
MESWDIAYVGNAHDMLYQHIAHYSKQADYYARFTSIVQSSGMGKSRTIDEFSKKRLVVPLNLRNNLNGNFCIDFNKCPVVDICTRLSST